MNKLGWILCAMAALALSACNSSNRPGGEVDSGTGITLDAGPGGGGTDAGPGGGDDAGPGGMRACEEAIAPYPAAASGRCSEDTRTCITGCGTDGMCINNCIAADATPPLMDMGGLTIDCGLCLGYNQFQCLDSMGSHTQVAAYFCCIEDNMCMDQACIQAMCGTQFMALGSSPGAAACIVPPAGGPYEICYTPMAMP